MHTVYTHGHNPSLLSHQLNKYSVTVKLGCIRWSVLPHPQHNYQLHTAVSHQDPQAITGPDNFISMRISLCPLCLSLSVSLTPHKYIHILPGPTFTLHTLSLPHIGLKSSSHCLIPQISFVFPRCPFRCSPRTNLSLSCVFSCLSCSDYSNRASWRALVTHGSLNVFHNNKKWYLQTRTRYIWVD